MLRDGNIQLELEVPEGAVDRDVIVKCKFKNYIDFLVHLGFSFHSQQYIYLILINFISDCIIEKKECIPKINIGFSKTCKDTLEKCAPRTFGKGVSLCGRTIRGYAIY